MTRYAYIFLDESGNFDFGNSGTRYLVLTSVGISRPSPMWGRLDDYKYHCIESGTDIEYFHCYNDRWPVRSAVFNLIAEHIDNLRICCVVNEKQRTAPEMREDKRLYPWMLGYLLRRALSEEQTAGAEEIIVITDTIPVTKKRRAVEKIIKQAVVSKQLPNVTYRILITSRAPTTGYRWPITAAGQSSGSGRGRIVPSMTESNQPYVLNSTPFRKDDPPDYSVAGESTLGTLVIRRGPLPIT